jgi:hypothetical protein
MFDVEIQQHDQELSFVPNSITIINGEFFCLICK